MSRLCRLKTASHGEDGKWAYGEIVKLRSELSALKAENEKAKALLDMWLWETVNQREEHAEARSSTQEFFKEFQYAAMSQGENGC